MSDFEREDMELAEVMGGRFVDLTNGDAGKPTAKAETKKQTVPAKSVNEEEKSADSQWEPVKPSANWFDKLRTTAKNVCLYAVLSMILFWWQQTGRLEETTSWYALCVCIGMMFFTIGRTWNGAVK